MGLPITQRSTPSRSSKAAEPLSLVVQVKLTQRDLNIIMMICDGKPWKEISSSLGISHTRYQQLRCALLLKIGVSSNIELLRWAIRQGIIEA